MYYLYVINSTFLTIIPTACETFV